MTCPDGLLTIDDVAHHLQTSRWSVGRVVKSGALQTISVPGRGRGGAKRVRVADYLACLNRCTDGPKGRIPAMTTLPNLHRFEDLAERYSWSLREMKKLTYGPDPKIEFVRVGQGLYFTDSQLIAFLNAKTTRPKRGNSPNADGLESVRARRSRRTTRPRRPERSAA